MSFAAAEANLGVALSAQGQLDDGAVHLERALVLRPEFAEAHRNLGENYAMRGRMKEAAVAYDSALKRLPDDVRLLNRLGWIPRETPNSRRICNLGWGYTRRDSRFEPPRAGVRFRRVGIGR